VSSLKKKKNSAMLKTHIEPQKTIFKSIKSENNSTFSFISVGSESNGMSSEVASGMASSGMDSGNTDSKSLKINKISFIISSLYDHVILTLLNQRQTQQSLFTLVPPPPPQTLPQINQAAKKTVLKPQTVSDDNPITCLLASLPIRSVDSVEAEEKYEFMLFTTATNGLLSCYSCAITMRDSMRDSVDDSMRDSIPIDAATRLTYQMKSGHQAIVLCMASSHDLLKSHSTSLNNSYMEKMAKNNLLLATGSADSTIRVWNGLKGFITHNLKGTTFLSNQKSHLLLTILSINTLGHAGIISALAFAPLPSTLSASKSQTPILLASASDDCTVRVWDLAQAKGVCVAVLRDHVAVVRELAWHPVHGKFLYSGSRDRVFIKW
jgi:WD40 repeat protein